MHGRYLTLHPPQRCPCHSSSASHPRSHIDHIVSLHHFVRFLFTATFVLIHHESKPPPPYLNNTQSLPFSTTFCVASSGISPISLAHHTQHLHRPRNQIHTFISTRPFFDISTFGIHHRPTLLASAIYRASEHSKPSKSSISKHNTFRAILKAQQQLFHRLQLRSAALLRQVSIGT